MMYKQSIDALSDLAGGSILATATQAGVEIALGGRYLELKRQLSAFAGDAAVQ